MRNDKTNPAEDMLAIGHRIRLLRNKKALTMEKMAETFGVSYQTVSKWEHGYAIPDFYNLRALKKYFNVSSDYILYGEDFSIVA